MPEISVIMPAFNAEKYLREAIDSILVQTYSDFELIIIDDGSTDSTPDIVKSYNDSRIRFIQNEHNMGVANTLNRGLELATGVYIARMDSDDISMPDRFEKQVHYLDTHPETVICGSSVIIFGENEDKRVFIFSGNDKQVRVDLIFNSSFAHPSIMMRKSCLKDNKLKYDPTCEKAEDYKLWTELIKYGNGYNFREPLLKYRYHGGQVTKTHIEEQTYALKNIRKSMYETLNLKTDEFFDIFCSICNGKRDFDTSEYSLLSKMFSLMIKNNINYDTVLLKRTLSLINYSVYRECRPKNYKPLSLYEILILTKRFLKKYTHT